MTDTRRNQTTGARQESQMRARGREGCVHSQKISQFPSRKEGTRAQREDPDAACRRTDSSKEEEQTKNTNAGDSKLAWEAGRWSTKTRHNKTERQNDSPDSALETHDLIRRAPKDMAQSTNKNKLQNNISWSLRPRRLLVLFSDEPMCTFPFSI